MGRAVSVAATSPHKRKLTHPQMNQSLEFRPTGEIASELCPFLIEFFQVEGIGFTCMAYCDAEGKWREAFDNTELHRPVHILQ